MAVFGTAETLGAYIQMARMSVQSILRASPGVNVVVTHNVNCAIFSDIPNDKLTEISIDISFQHSAEAVQFANVRRWEFVRDVDIEIYDMIVFVSPDMLVYEAFDRLVKGSLPNNVDWPFFAANLLPVKGWEKGSCESAYLMPNFPSPTWHPFSPDLLFVNTAFCAQMSRRWNDFLFVSPPFFTPRRDIAILNRIAFDLQHELGSTCVMKGVVDVRNCSLDALLAAPILHFANSDIELKLRAMRLFHNRSGVQANLNIVI